MSKIDFVITWVDGSDPVWLEEKDRVSKLEGRASDNKNNRYRDWDTIKFLFRSIEKNTPWVNKVYLITYGHLPKWLNIDNPKLVVVNHKDYIPSEYLPTFNSNAIELNMNKIKDLSEAFVYFNDDLIILNPCSEEDFFKDGLPCNTAIEAPHIPCDETINYANITNTEVINRYYDKKKCIKKNLFKWFNFKYGKGNFKTFSQLGFTKFTGFKTHHLAYSMNKSILDWLWKHEFDLLDNTCKNTFRNKYDCNQWLVSDMQIASGNFYPRSINFGKSMAFTDNISNNDKIINTIASKKYKIICLNDNVTKDDIFDRELENMTKALLKRFPNKSSFEK